MNNIYLKQAEKGKNNFWRYLVVYLLVIMVSSIASIVLAVGAILIEGTIDINQFSPMTMLIIGMLPYPLALIVLLLGVLYFHGRPVMSLVNPTGRFAWGRLAVSAGCWFVISAAADFIMSLLQPGNYVWSFDLKRFLPYFIVALILTPIQTSTEELIFRAYLPQGLSRLTPRLWLPLVVPSIVFGLLHGANPEVGMYGMLLTLPVYIGIGLVLGWITIKSQSLELALGLHLANNLYAGLMVTFPGSSLPSPALFTIQQYDAALALVVFLLTSGIYLGIVYAFGLMKPPKMPVVEVDGGVQSPDIIK